MTGEGLPGLEHDVAGTHDINATKNVGLDLGDLGTEDYGVVVQSCDRLDVVGSGGSGGYEPAPSIDDAMLTTMMGGIPRNRGKSVPT